MEGKRVSRSKYASRLLLGILSMLTMVLYQNCGTDFVPLDDAALASLGKFVCSTDSRANFEKTYYPFFRANCASCHAGSAPVNFALPAVEEAFTEFQKDPVDKIRTYATNPNHGSGAGGPKNASAIQTAESNYTSCTGAGSGPGSTTMARTAPIVINPTATLALRTINLDSQLVLGSANFSTAKFYFQVQSGSVGGVPLYYIVKPSLGTGTAAVAVKNIRILINGNLVSNATTFNGVNKTIPAGTNPLNGQTPNGNLSLSSAIIDMPAAAPTTDTVQFEFEILQAQ